MTVSISGTNGVTFPDSSLQAAAASPYVLKNRIINGDMRIWQRGTSFTVGSASYTYTADRFKNYSANTSTTVSRSTSVPTTAGSLFQYSFQLQRPNGNTGTNSLSIVQIIETANCYDLAGQSVTFSFWVKKGANYSGGNITVQILTGTVADQGGDPYSFTGLATAINDSSYNPTTTWTRVTYTGTIASNALEVCPVIAFTPTGTAGADDSLYITGVQLEIGSTATPFERRLYNQELANCQRYYYRMVASGNYTQFGLTTSRGSSNSEMPIQYPVPMRVAPTSVDYSALLLATFAGGSTSAVSSISINSSNVGFISGALNIIAAGSIGTGGQALQVLANNNTAAYLGLSAEL